MHHQHDCNCDHSGEESTPKCVATFVSRNDAFKAAVYALGEKFEVAVYTWKEVDGDIPVWERVAGPIILDTQAAAETWGQQNLAVYAGEKLDNTAGDDLRNEVQSTLGHDNFDFLEPQNFEVSFLESEDSEEFLPIPQVDKVMAAGDFYFVQYKEAWLAGFLYDTGNIRCWKKFDDLKTALLETV